MIRASSIAHNLGMRFNLGTLLVLAAAPVPFLCAAKPQTSPSTQNCEDVYKNIAVFKGVPAKDLIPAMQFMCASLKYECVDCHEENDYAAETRTKESARKMVILQRDINDKHFGGKLEVTCMSCHNGREKPNSLPLPATVKLRHDKAPPNASVSALFGRHIKASGAEMPMLVLKGSMTETSDHSDKKDKTPYELIQAKGGLFRLTFKHGTFGFDGKTVWTGEYPMSDEPAAIFGRMGRSWRGRDAFAGLEKTSVSGIATINGKKTTVVRGTRAMTGSTEELYFDNKSGLLIRLVNVTRSSIGAVVSTIDYDGFKSVGNAKVPMKVKFLSPDGTVWDVAYSNATVSQEVKENLFIRGGK